ncbi:MAG TPA: DUF6635 family protein [Candidatus Polarisedimenticolaceae bacterium]|nr:DUF6635 family protein [Candidatus Polarisedimenticolaceae bacterium]
MVGQASPQVDRGIQTYVERCRKRIPGFVEQHFSLRQTWALQRPTLGLDLLLAPLNSAWALPYIALHKTAETLEKVGWPAPARWTKHLPSAIKTGYQVEIERLICAELLEWNRELARAPLPQGLVQELRAVPGADRLIERMQREAAERPRGRTLPDLLRQFTSGRAIVSDVAGTLLTLGLSWITLGNTSLSLQGIAYGMAKQQAHDRAASRFFLGKRMGSRFYDLFPPDVPQTSVNLVLVLLALGLTAAAMACTIFSDPIRKTLGFHRNRLQALVEDMEKELIVLAHKATIPLS